MSRRRRFFFFPPPHPASPIIDWFRLLSRLFNHVLVLVGRELLLIVSCCPGHFYAMQIEPLWLERGRIVLFLWHFFNCRFCFRAGTGWDRGPYRMWERGRLLLTPHRHHSTILQSDGQRCEPFKRFINCRGQGKLVLDSRLILLFRNSSSSLKKMFISFLYSFIYFNAGHELCFRFSSYIYQFLNVCSQFCYWFSSYIYQFLNVDSQLFFWFSSYQFFNAGIRFRFWFSSSIFQLLDRHWRSTFDVNIC